MFRRRRGERAAIDQLTATVTDLRQRLAAALELAEYRLTIIQAQGRRLDAAQRGPLGDTLRMPRVRSEPPPGPDDGDLLVPWPSSDTPAGL